MQKTQPNPPPTTVLRTEHRIIERVLAIIRRAIGTRPEVKPGLFTSFWASAGASMC